jgi:hypothetical protein
MRVTRFLQQKSNTSLLGRANLFNFSNKVRSERFFRRELKENPEFFKAFPHLQAMFDDGKTPKDQKVSVTDKYQGDKQINLSMAENPENKFFTSLTD